MFDIGFWELCLIAVVALLILGPERLPVAARTAGLWLAKARQMATKVKSEIDRELQLDEVRKQLKEEEVNLKNTTGINDLESLAGDTIDDVKSFNNNMDENQISSTNDEQSSTTDPKTKTTETDNSLNES